MSNLQQRLISTGDFLSITREFEQSIPQPFTFNLSDNSNKNKILVSVKETGIIVFEPIDQPSSKDIVLSSAIHGNETAPIEICQDLIKRLIKGELNLTQRVLFIFGNPKAINIGKRFDEENLNRLFSGGHSLDQGNGAGLINAERHRALLLENTVREFFEQGSEISSNRERIHYDLHTAIRGSKKEKFAVYPYLHGAPRNKQQCQFLSACGVNTVLLSESPTTTFSYFSAHEFNAHAFTVELGQVKPFGENDMSKFEAVSSQLAQLISTVDYSIPNVDISTIEFFKINQVINRTHEQFSLNFADDVENFTPFEQGGVFATDGDISYTAQVDGEAVIFPNAQVAIGQRALLTVIPSSLN